MFDFALGERARRAFERDLVQARTWNARKNRIEKRRGHKAGSAAAEVKSFRFPLPLVVLDFVEERSCVRRAVRLRGDAGGEVTKSTLLCAKGVRDVDARHGLLQGDGLADQLFDSFGYEFVESLTAIGQDESFARLAPV